MRTISFILIYCLLAVPAWGQTRDPAPPDLVADLIVPDPVWIDGVYFSGGKPGFDMREEDMKDAVEVILRRNSVPVSQSLFRDVNDLQKGVLPSLRVRILTLPITRGRVPACVFNVRAEVRVIASVGETHLWAVVWGNGSTGVAEKRGCAQFVKEELQEIIEQFALRYLRGKDKRAAANRSRPQ